MESLDRFEPSEGQGKESTALEEGKHLIACRQKLLKIADHSE